MTQQRLYARLILAVLLPLILVTATLWPVLHMHLETRQESIREETRAILQVGESTLLRDINETLSYALAIAEMPIIKAHMTSEDTENTENSTSAQLSSFLSTLVRHYPRYTKLTLIDNQGNEVLSAPTELASDPRFTAKRHASTDYFKAASKLLARDLYISPPGRNLQYELFSGEVIPVVNVATPIFDDQGEREGVVLLSLNWQHLSEAVHQAMHIDPDAGVLLADAQGGWLLTEGSQRLPMISFGDNYARLAAEPWQPVTEQVEGAFTLGNHQLRFQRFDIRSQGYQGLAGRIFSQDDTLPWVLGVSLTMPTWKTLLQDDASVIWFLLLTYSTAVALGIYWSFSSHQQRKLRHQAVLHANEVSKLYDSAPCGYHSLNADGVILKMNQTELDWLNLDRDAIGQRCYLDFVSPASLPDVEAAFQDVKAGQQAEAECTLVADDGQTRHVIIQAVGYRENNRFMYSNATVFDITERKQLEEKLRAQAMTDPLTGVFNRRYLQAQASIEISRASRHDTPISLIAIDIDHFKHINDEYGHDAGDEVLKRFTDVIKGLLRQEDLLCRVGGEEFAILLPSTALDRAQQVAERIRAAVEQAQVSIENADVPTTIYITASFGVTHIERGEKTLKAAIKRADNGLYEAKETGRNRIVISLRSKSS
ncbi:sensor domain-containing diguanylate cyclase [Vreelandella arcis]|uniref:diguanylate cyclase n=1 Tax=Vreelandella arcis TaxID=416873 RepID=A0A1G9X1B2_9GAMM|nr:diguanylate cyclase [Halomonas arcis]SDM90534.1 PAS domain S-box-containing protein/diguanylate cyclase (GGDEF) domain-containing protein [Halomonas arcis]